MKWIYKWLFAWTIMLGCFVFPANQTEAARVDENVSVTVSSQISVVFEADGSNTVSNFMIENHSPVPIHVTNIIASTYHDWELVSPEHTILADQKKLSFSFQGQYLEEGNNFLQITVPEQGSVTPSISIRRGAFRENCSNEKALELSVEYAFGKKEFQLKLDSGEDSEQISVQNGESVKLPIPKRIKYQFLGWEDADGNLYQDTYLMPMQDVTLKAKWQWTEAYALYTREDECLSFVRSTTPYTVGMMWQGKVINAVYTGFEEIKYNSATLSPWWEQHNLQRVEVFDDIQPLYTAYWFYGAFNVSYLNLEKLETSQVTDMTAMFSATGRDVLDTVTLKGIKNWDTSKVQYFGSIFRRFGANAVRVEFEDISGWDTSSAIEMGQFFLSTAEKAGIYVDCSKWNVYNVTKHSQFKDWAGGTIIEPKWVK